MHTYALHEYFRANSWAREQLGAYQDESGQYYFDCLVGFRKCSASDWGRLGDLYRAELESVDRGFGKLIGAVEEAGEVREAYFLLVSDHGEGFDPGSFAP